MLCRLSIRNILLIDKLDLEFGAGLNVLTGETGAGKSILLDSLGLVLGWRGPANLVRQGENQGEVLAEFVLAQNHPAHQILDEVEVEIEDALILRRVVNRDGRKRGFVNDRPVSTDLLRRIGETLVESHGQHDDKGLLNEKSHIQFLDQFGGFDLGVLKAHYKDWVEARQDLLKFEESADALLRERDFLAHSIDELSKLDVAQGEADALTKKRRDLQKGEKLAGEFSALMAFFSESGSSQNLAEALRRAQGLEDQIGEEVAPAVESLERALDGFSEAETLITDLAMRMEFSPEALEIAEERLFAIRAAERKYQLSADELPDKLSQFQQELFELDHRETNMENLQARERALYEVLEAEAEKISEARLEAARHLDQAVMAELAPLKLERAEFETVIETGDIQASGKDKIRFVVKTNPGAPAGSLSKIASGGELSRFLLALKVSLHERGGKTLIFDEIDRGVGGQTADAVGRRLRRLAGEDQLLIVTHSPQVAALGETHFQVLKSQQDTMSKTEVKPLGHESRIHEIARMISGDQVSDEALAAARKLIEEGNE